MCAISISKSECGEKLWPPFPCMEGGLICSNYKMDLESFYIIKTTIVFFLLLVSMTYHILHSKEQYFQVWSSIPSKNYVNLLCINYVEHITSIFWFWSLYAFYKTCSSFFSKVTIKGAPPSCYSSCMHINILKVLQYASQHFLNLLLSG